MASTRWPPKSWAACSMCAFARRRDSSASRISGCRAAGVAAGVAGSALAAGVEGGLVLLGAGGAAAMNVNARMRHARASRLTILVFMKHSSRPNYGSDRRICASYSHLHAWRLIPVDECHGHAPPERPSSRLPNCLRPDNPLVLGHLHRHDQKILVPRYP